MIELKDVGDEPGNFPDKADVVVVGGGIIGIAAAYFMAARGAAVVVVEKGRVAAEQSSRNWGWCRQQGRAAAELALIKESMGLWERLTMETERELGFRRSGIHHVTDDRATLGKWETWLEGAQRAGIDSRSLTAAEAQALLPSDKRWIGGLFTPSDGRAEPGLAVPAIAEAARDRGVKIFQGCAARGLAVDGGKLVGVMTERGTIRAARVLCAAGAWSSVFLRPHGIYFPQLLIRGSVLRTEPAPEVIKGAISSPLFTLRRRIDGGYTMAVKGSGRFDMTVDAIRYARPFWPLFRKERNSVKIKIGRELLASLAPRGRLDAPSPFERVRVLDPEPDLGVLDRGLANLKRTFPALANVGVAARWAGAIDAMPDAIPVISGVPSLPGLFLATGFSGHGFGIGPGAGHLAADLTLGREPIADPQPFRYTRLIDGTKFVPDVGL